MTEHPKQEWVTPKISLFDSEDTERGKPSNPQETDVGTGVS
jgi:hypothetical protein